MDLTLESAFSPGGLVGHAAYMLLVLSMLMRTMSLLRILVIFSALVAIAYAWFWLKDPVGVFWEALLVLVNLVQLAITWHQNRTARFSKEEKTFLETHLPGLSLGQARKLLNQGMWITGETDTQLTREGVPVSHLYYLASGEGLVISGGHPVAKCEPGSFIGEMTVMSGEPANGSVQLLCISRYWAIEADRLRKLAYRDPEIGKALDASFARNMREKLVRSNRSLLATDEAKKSTPTERAE